MSLIDRTDLPAARLNGAEAALGLGVGQRYTIVTCVFFVRSSASAHELTGGRRSATSSSVRRAVGTRLTCRRDPRQLFVSRAAALADRAVLFKRFHIPPRIWLPSATMAFGTMAVALPALTLQASSSCSPASSRAGTRSLSSASCSASLRLLCSLAASYVEPPVPTRSLGQFLITGWYPCVQRLHGTL